MAKKGLNERKKAEKPAVKTPNISSVISAAERAQSTFEKTFPDPRYNGSKNRATVSGGVLRYSKSTLSKRNQIMSAFNKIMRLTADLGSKTKIEVS